MLNWRFHINNTEEFAPFVSLRGSATGVAARVVVDDRREGRDIESLRGRMSECERQVDGLFESLLAESIFEDGGG